MPLTRAELQALITAERRSRAMERIAWAIIVAAVLML